jgi:hypothetical protein
MKRIYLIGLAFALLQQTAAAQNKGLDAEVDALTERVEKLEGTRAIKKLQRAFGFYVDRGLWDQAADLFTDDGSIEIGVDGVYVGKDRIQEYLKRLHGGQDGLIYGQLNEWIRRQQRHCTLARSRDAEPVQTACRVARWNLRKRIRQRRRNMEDLFTASLRQLRCTL